MKLPEEIKKALELCTKSQTDCTACPYDSDSSYSLDDLFSDKPTCNDELEYDALEYIQQLEQNQTKHGKWERREEYHGYLGCSECHNVFIMREWVQNGKWNYCPSCGAKMEVEV